jgi:hypothetical protein
MAAAEVKCPRVIRSKEFCNEAGGRLESASRMCFLPKLPLAGPNCFVRNSGGVRLVPDRALVPPAPILALFIAVQPIELAVLVMPLSQPSAVRPRFTVTPAILVCMMLVVIPHSRRTSARQKRRKHRRAQHQRAQISLYSQHFAILLRISSFRSRSCADYLARRLESPGDLRGARCQLFIKHRKRAQVAICSNGLSEILVRP